MFGKLHFGGEFESQPGGQPDFTKPMKTGPIQWGFDYSYVLLGGHQAPPFMFFENNRVAGDAEKVTQLEAGPLNGGIVRCRDLVCRTGTAGRWARRWWKSRSHSSIRKGQAVLHSPVHRRRHGPYTPPETLLGTPVKGESKMTPKTDMAYEVDVVVGKLVEALEKRGLLDSTLIVVTSDNGGIPADRAHGHDAVGGLRGSKSQIWEGGHRVPFVAQWKGHVPAGTVRNQIIGTHDIVPTFVELAGGKFEPEQMLDSVSLAPVLLGKRGDDQPVRQTLLIQSSPGRDAFTERDPKSPSSKSGAKRKGKTARPP